MGKDPEFDLKVAHRWFGVEANNTAWKILDDAARSPARMETAIHRGHASLYHWSEIGTAAHRARGLCLLAFLYAELGDGASAERWARRCLEEMTAAPDDMQDWDWAFGYEGLARAHAAAGEKEAARAMKAKARELGDAIADPEDKKIFDAAFISRNWYGVE
jgi:hypothetical protein